MHNTSHQDYIILLHTAIAPPPMKRKIRVVVLTLGPPRDQKPEQPQQQHAEEPPRLRR